MNHSSGKSSDDKKPTDMNNIPDDIMNFLINRNDTKRKLQDPVESDKINSILNTAAEPFEYPKKKMKTLPDPSNSHTRPSEPELEPEVGNESNVAIFEEVGEKMELFLLKVATALSGNDALENRYISEIDKLIDSALHLEENLKQQKETLRSGLQVLIKSLKIE